MNTLRLTAYKVLKKIWVGMRKFVLTWGKILAMPQHRRLKRQYNVIMKYNWIANRKLLWNSIEQKLFGKTNKFPHSHELCQEFDSYWRASLSNLYYTVFHKITYLCKKQFYFKRMWQTTTTKKTKAVVKYRLYEISASWNIKARR